MGEKRRYVRKQEPTIAPGLENDELYRAATPEEVRKGDYTMVTRLSWEENFNGSSESSREES